MDCEQQARGVENRSVPAHRERLGLRLEPLGLAVVAQMHVRQRTHIERARAQHTRRRRAFRDARFDELLELERSLPVPEHLLEQKEKRGAVQADERLLRAGARRVNGFGDELLAGAALAHDEDARSARPHLRDELQDRLHLRIRADDVPERVPLAEAIAELPRLLEEACLLHRPLDDGRQRLEIERLRQVVLRPFFHGGDGLGSELVCSCCDPVSFRGRRGRLLSESDQGIQALAPFSGTAAGPGYFVDECALGRRFHAAAGLPGAQMDELAARVRAVRRDWRGVGSTLLLLVPRQPTR